MSTPFQRKPTVGVSLKMYFTLQQTASYISACAPLASLTVSEGVSLFIIPSFLSLSTARSLLHPSSIQLGAQNCFWEDSGAYTGEVSPRDLKDAGCSIVELGHAERRALFGEVDEMVGRKARAVVRNGMTPLVCIGERHRGTVEEAVEECRPQIEVVLEATKEGEEEVIFAYEPVWAIGKAEPAKADYVVAVTKDLRKLCGKRKVRFLYGGSAGPGTYGAMREGVDGLFLGRFGHDPERLAEVIREVGT